jgi:hypothetical protein
MMWAVWMGRGARPAGEDMEARMGLFTNKHDATVQAVDPRRPHEYKAPVSTWRTGCDVCGQTPEDPVHVAAPKPDEPEMETSFNWPS